MPAQTSTTSKPVPRAVLNGLAAYFPGSKFPELALTSTGRKKRNVPPRLARDVGRGRRTRNEPSETQADISLGVSRTFYFETVGNSNVGTESERPTQCPWSRARRWDHGWQLRATNLGRVDHRPAPPSPQTATRLRFEACERGRRMYNVFRRCTRTCRGINTGQR